ncbi:MAG: hypothetical protein ACI9TH_000882 [Kiritimatiellia bacterium]
MSECYYDENSLADYRCLHHNYFNLKNKQSTSVQENQMMKKIIIACSISLATCSAFAAEKAAFQLSLTPDVALQDRETLIEGVTLNIWGENPQKALAIGLVNGSTGDSAGISLAWALNYAENYSGLQYGVVNYTSGDFLGWQSGFVNYTKGNFKGLQTGAVNYAGTLTGIQLGFVNFAESAQSGIQLGFLNLIPENEWFSNLPDQMAKGMIFANWGF